MITRDYEAYWSDLKGSHAFHPGNRFRYRTIVRELRRLDLNPKDIVDCGCGDGSLICSLRELYPDSALYGMDVADNVPVNRAQIGIHFRQLDLGRRVADDLTNRFDLLVCSEVIEHVDDDRCVIENLIAMARPGATIMLTTQRGRIYRTEQYLGHLRHYKTEYLCEKLNRAGAEIVTAHACGWPFLNLQKIAAHHMFSSVQRLVVEPRQLSRIVRFGLSVLTALYMLSSSSWGPQIIIVARRRS